MRHSPLALGFLGGVLIRSFVDLGRGFLFTFLLFGVVFLLVALFQTQKQPFIMIAIFLLSFSIGIIRYQSKDISSSVLYDDLPQTFEAIVINEPDLRDTHTRLTLASDELEGKILATVSSYPAFNYGDVLKVSGLVKRPGRDFLESEEYFF